MGKQWKQWETIFLISKITADGDCSHEMKRCLLLGRKVMTNLDSIFKSRDITLLIKFHLIKAMVFPAVKYRCEGCTIKKAEHQRIYAFELWCWKRLLTVPWTARRSNPSICPTLCDPMDCSLPGSSLHGILQARVLEWVAISFFRRSSQPRDRTQVFHIPGRRLNLWATREAQRKSVLNINWKDWCWSWNSNTLATWSEELTHWKRPWCWERLRAGGEVDNRGWNDWMASLTQWTWIWVNSGSWWWTGRPVVLQFMGSQSQTRLSDWTDTHVHKA